MTALVLGIDLPCLPTGPSWREIGGPRPSDSRIAAFAFGAKATVETTPIPMMPQMDIA